MYSSCVLLITVFAAMTIAGPLVDPSSNENGKIVSPDLLMDAFEVLRRLILDGFEEEESKEVSKDVELPSHYSPLLRLDPLCLNKPVVVESRDNQTPILGKIVLTLENTRFSGLSAFKVDKIDNAGPCLNFRHVIPKLDVSSNYTVEYYLFDSIPLRISEGQLKAAIPEAKISGKFFSFASVIGDWSRMSQFNLTTTVDDDIALVVYPKYTISDRFVLKKEMSKFDLAIKKSLPEVTDILKNAYSRVIEMKLSQ